MRDVTGVNGPEAHQNRQDAVQYRVCPMVLDVKTCGWRLIDMQHDIRLFLPTTGRSRKSHLPAFFCTFGLAYLGIWHLSPTHTIPSSLAN